jgi:hypothetical protein
LPKYFLLCLLVPALSLSAQAAKPAAPKANEAAPAKTNEEQIDASLAELEALIRDSRLQPKKKGAPAQLEDFREDLEISSVPPATPQTTLE